jgi:hypothetical protein
MPLARLEVPFDHPDWIFEPKLDGFRAVAYVDSGTCRLVSRNRNAFKPSTHWQRRSVVRPGPDGRRHDCHSLGGFKPSPLGGGFSTRAAD